MVQQNFRVVLPLGGRVLTDQHHVDEIARQDKSGDAAYVVDTHRNRPFAFLKQGGKRSALTRSGDFGAQKGLVPVERGKHNPASILEEFLFADESAVRNPRRSPRNFPAI